MLLYAIYVIQLQIRNIFYNNNCIYYDYIWRNKKFYCIFLTYFELLSAYYMTYFRLFKCILYDIFFENKRIFWTSLVIISQNITLLTSVKLLYFSVFIYSFNEIISRLILEFVFRISESLRQSKTRLLSLKKKYIICR